MNLKKLNNSALIGLYGSIIEELKGRKIIRTKNLVGDLGEYLAIEYYCNTPGLPKLQFAPPSTENIDAISTKGKRYSIKSTTSNTTGVFYGLNPLGSAEPQEQLFEYALIVSLDDNYQLKKIVELNWENFLKHKKWHSRMQAWHLTISKQLIDDAQIVFPKEPV